MRKIHQFLSSIKKRCTQEKIGSFVSASLSAYIEEHVQSIRLEQQGMSNVTTLHQLLHCTIITAGGVA